MRTRGRQRAHPTDSVARRWIQTAHSGALTASAEAPMDSEHGERAAHRRNTSRAAAGLKSISKKRFVLDLLYPRQSATIPIFGFIELGLSGHKACIGLLHLLPQIDAMLLRRTPRAWSPPAGTWRALPSGFLVDLKVAAVCI